MAQKIVFNITDDQEASILAYLENNANKESIKEFITRYLSEHIHQIAARHPRGAFREKVLARDKLDQEIRDMTKISTVE